MKFANYATDFLILPETTKERHNLQSYYVTKRLKYKWCFSDVKGQNWHGTVY